MIRTPAPPLSNTGLRPPAASNGQPAPRRTFGRTRGVVRKAYKIVLYGTGGVGKTELSSKFPGVVFADIERGSEDHGIDRVSGIENWSDLRAWVRSDDAAKEKAVCIDSGSKAEEWCLQWVLANIPTEKGNKVSRIEDYGYGKGYVHAHEEWKGFLADLSALWAKGVNVILVAHEQVSLIPNPAGDDFKRYQPRIQSSEKANSLAATKEWADHVFFVCYDVVVKDGKAKGGGTRTIYCTETATHMAKTRTLSGEPIPFEKNSTQLWDTLLNAATVAVDDVPPAD
jgi:GTPase SAR1 family protein